MGTLQTEGSPRAKESPKAAEGLERHPLPSLPGIPTANCLVPKAKSSLGQSASRPRPLPIPRRQIRNKRVQGDLAAFLPRCFRSGGGGGAAPGPGSTPFPVQASPSETEPPDLPRSRTHLRSTAARRGSPCGPAHSPRPANAAVPARPPARRRCLPPALCRPQP